MINRARYFLLAIVMTLLSGCNDNIFGFQCVSPYDFGSPKLYVDAQGSPPLVGDVKRGQYSGWLNSNYIYSSQPIVADVGAYPYWIAWYGGPGAKIPTATVNPPTMCPLSSIGVPVSANSTVRGDLNSSISSWCSPPGVNGLYANINPYHIPCPLLYGLGLYLSINPNSNQTIINSSPQLIKNPMASGFFNKHLFAPNSNWQVSTCSSSSCSSGSSGTTLAPGQSGNSSAASPPGEMAIQNSQINSSSSYQGASYTYEDYAGGTVYLKILDNYYGDNYGGYNVNFKGGVVNPNGPFRKIGEIFEDQLNSAFKSNFNNLVSNPQYVFIVRMLLTLYIAIMGIMFALGMLAMTQKDVLARIIKFSIVSTLISDRNCWDFFNNYFFNIFTNGLSEIVSIITSVLIGNLGESNNSTIGAFVFFDQLMRIFFSVETQAKIVSLLSIWVGIYMIPIIYFGIFYFGIIICKTFVYYLTSLLVITLLLLLTPIYLCFMLFTVTKPLFDSWLQQLVSYTIQPILYIAGLMMVSLMIINEFQKIMGYGVCWKEVINVLGVVLFSNMSPETNSNNNSTILVPNYGFYKNNSPDDSAVSSYHLCQPYECTQVRYIDLPYLDPNNDSSLLAELLRSDYGKGAHFSETLLFIVLIFFADKFLDIIPTLSKSIAGTPYQQADVKAASDNAFKSMASHALNVVSASKRAVNIVGKGVGALGGNRLVKTLKRPLTGSSKAAQILSQSSGVVAKILKPVLKVPVNFLKEKLTGQSPELAGHIGDGIRKLKDGTSRSLNKAGKKAQETKQRWANNLKSKARDSLLNGDKKGAILAKLQLFTLNVAFGAAKAVVTVARAANTVANLDKSIDKINARGKAGLIEYNIPGMDKLKNSKFGKKMQKVKETLRNHSPANIRERILDRRNELISNVYAKIESNPSMKAISKGTSKLVDVYQNVTTIRRDSRALRSALKDFDQGKPGSIVALYKQIQNNVIENNGKETYGVSLTRDQKESMKFLETVLKAQAQVRSYNRVDDMINDGFNVEKFLKNYKSEYGDEHIPLGIRKFL